MHFRHPLVALLAASLFAAAPAYAQEQGPVVPPDAPVCDGVGDTVTSCSTGGDETGAPAATVGPGQVVTDPAAEIDEPPPAEDTGEPREERGELHVLSDAKTSSSEPAAAPVAAARKQAPAATARRQAPTGSAGARTLPFTGVDAAPLALVGAMLLAAGYGLRRAAAA